VAAARTAQCGAALDALKRLETSRPVEVAAALLLGLLAFLLVVGSAPLDPTNIAWLTQGDAATNYLGWAFFRTSPWGWPPAANPAYGLDIAGSVMMADANPLLALPFKLLSPLLPTPFQYFGWWLLACFLLHALFARAIAARISVHAEQRLAIAALFLFAPCLLIRVATPEIFHMTLCGQWQILAAFWIYLSPDLPRRAIRWTVLVAVAVLTHPYLLVLVVAIWLADVMRELLLRRAPSGRIFGGAVLVTLVAAAVAKLSGVFWLARAGKAVSGADGGTGLSSYGEWGFGFFKANLLSPFDPQGWSWLLPDLPSGKGEIEGFAYLGLGVLLLAAAALPFVRRVWPKRRIGREHLPLMLVLFALAMFALTPNVAIGATSFQIPWPAPLVAIGNLFRSSGRFAWPLVYAAMIAVCWIVARGPRRAIGSTLLIAAALVQVADGSAGWRAYATNFALRGPAWPTALKSPFWDEAGHRYRSIRLVVPRNHLPEYRDLNAWALAHGIQTDIIYLARFDGPSFEAMALRRAAELRDGRLSRDTLWITHGVSAEALARMPRHATDLIATVDGIPVFAPGFRARIAALSLRARGHVPDGDEQGRDHRPDHQPVETHRLKPAQRRDQHDIVGNARFPADEDRPQDIVDHADHEDAA
jgi:hypothetical protein